MPLAYCIVEWDGQDMIRQDRQRANMTASRGWMRGRRKIQPCLSILYTRQKVSLAVLLNREWAILGETKRDEVKIPLEPHPSPLLEYLAFGPLPCYRPFFFQPSTRWMEQGD